MCDKMLEDAAARLNIITAGASFSYRVIVYDSFVVMCCDALPYAHVFDIEDFMYGNDIFILFHRAFRYSLVYSTPRKKFEL